MKNRDRSKIKNKNLIFILQDMMERFLWEIDEFCTEILFCVQPFYGHANTGSVFYNPEAGTVESWVDFSLG